MKKQNLFLKKESNVSQGIKKFPKIELLTGGWILGRDPKNKLIRNLPT